MSLFRWLSVALATLATTSALNAQTAPFSALGLTALFGQEASSEAKRLDGCLVVKSESRAVSNAATNILPRLPLTSLGFSFELLGAEETQEAEVSPPSRRCDLCLMPGFVAQCLAIWNNQWARGNYEDAALLAAIACRLDPTNVIAQHALAISDLMQTLPPIENGELVQAIDGSFGTSNRRDLTIAAPGVMSLGMVQGQFSPFRQLNSVFNGIGSCTLVDPSLFRKVIVQAQLVEPIKPRCTDAGCCTTSVANTCPACQASQKVKSDIAALLTSLKQLQTQITSLQSKGCPACTVGSTTAAKADCCCVKTAQVQVQACPSGACGTSNLGIVTPTATFRSCTVDQGCGGCLNTGAGNTIMVAPTPYLMIQKVPAGHATWTFLDEFHNFMSMPMPTQVYNANPLSPLPSMFLSSEVCEVPFATQPFACPVQSPFTNAPTTSRDYAMPVEAVRPATLTVSRKAPAAKRNVHLVTPNMEAHCERLTSGGNADHIVLEGDVQLTCNRNGQSIRIQGQRVVVHLADGTFTVESAPESRVAAPVSRVGYVVKPGAYLQTLPYEEVVCPPAAASSLPRSGPQD